MANKGGPKKAAYDKAYGARPEQKEARAQRNAARREAEREGKVHKGDGKDVDHKTPIRKGGTNADSNTRVVDIIETLRGYNCDVDVFDPWVDAAEAQHEYGLVPINDPQSGSYDAVILAVGHDQFRALGGQGVRAFGKPAGSVVFDVKHVLPRDAVDARL